MRANLTDDELLALKCLSVGMTPEMAAVTMGSTVGQVDERAEAARHKLRAKNTTHACAEALRRGLIP